MLFRSMMSLYVASHYKNSPNDLQLMSDAPGQHLFVLLPPLKEGDNTLPDPLVVMQVRSFRSSREVFALTIWDRSPSKETSPSRAFWTTSVAARWPAATSSRGRSRSRFVGLLFCSGRADSPLPPSVPGRRLCFAFWSSDSQDCCAPRLRQGPFLSFIQLAAADLTATDGIWFSRSSGAQLVLLWRAAQLGRSHG